MNEKEYKKLKKVIDSFNKSEILLRKIKTIDIIYDYDKIKGFEISY